MSKFQVVAAGTLDKAIITANISGTKNFYTGSGWSTSFGSVHTYHVTLVAGGFGGIDDWELTLPVGIDLTALDDETATLQIWQSGSNPANDQSFAAYATVSTSSGGGGGTTINISATPVDVVGASDNGTIELADEIEANQGDDSPFIFYLYQTDGTTPYTGLSGKTVKFIVGAIGETSGLGLFQQDVVVGGDDNNAISFTISAANTATYAGEIYPFWLKNVDDNRKPVIGFLVINYAAGSVAA